MKVARDKFGTKLKFPNRTCKECSKYPCFEGIDNCKSNFAAMGCSLYGIKSKISCKG